MKKISIEYSSVCNTVWCTLGRHHYLQVDVKQVTVATRVSRHTFWITSQMKGSLYQLNASAICWSTLFLLMTNFQLLFIDNFNIKFTFCKGDIYSQSHTRTSNFKPIQLDFQFIAFQIFFRISPQFTTDTRARIRERKSHFNHLSRCLSH